MAIPISDPDAISCKPKLSTIVSCSLLVIFWLYLLSWGIILIHLLLQDTGPWELDEWLISVTNLAGIIVIAAYFVRCLYRNLWPRLGDWLPWLARMVYLSVILALCDCWHAASRQGTLFSHTIWKMKDGGTTGSIGFGYILVYHRKINDTHGPEVWFWFTPVMFSDTTKHTGVCWWVQWKD